MKYFILNAAMNSARDLAYYNRKEDEDLPRGEIQKAIKRGEITIEEIVSAFKAELIEWLEE